MLGNDILAFIRPEMLVLIPVLIILGQMLKKATYIEDWTIPIILGGIGIILAILILGFAEDFTGEIILNGILQGILAAGMAVYVHQLTIQSARKRIEDNEDPPKDA